MKAFEEWWPVRNKGIPADRADYNCHKIAAENAFRAGMLAAADIVENEIYGVRSQNKVVAKIIREAANVET